eukprot:1593536-Pleurochrysis_carterae.AAC.1
MSWVATFRVETRDTANRTFVVVPASYVAIRLKSGVCGMASAAAALRRGALLWQVMKYEIRSPNGPGRSLTLGA